MRLPASVLGSLRLGLGATALLAGGCDAQEARTLEPATTSVPAPALEALDAPQVVADVVAVRERSAVQAPRRSRRAAQEILAVTTPAAAELSEDPTAFVPFAEQPGDAQPIRPRIRTRARPRPRTQPRPVEVGSRWHTRPSTTEGRKWEGDNCPACGRG